MKSLHLRAATIADADTLKRVFEYASYGIAPYFWNQSRQAGESIDEVAERRMLEKFKDPDQRFIVAEVDGQPAGGLLSYAITETEEFAGHSPMMRSFIAIDNALVGTRYVNALAVFPEFRRLGVASALLDHERVEAAKEGTALALSVCDENPAAISTYRKNGFATVGSIPVVKEGWVGDGSDWILMVNERDCAWAPPSDQFVPIMEEVPV